jgi:hypothetical protein
MTSPTTTNATAEQAREMLAAEYETGGWKIAARNVRDGIADVFDNCALRAITRALSTPPEAAAGEAAVVEIEASADHGRSVLNCVLPVGTKLYLATPAPADDALADARRKKRIGPRREVLAGLLAALHYGQYATGDDKKALDRSIERALRNFNIGSHRFEAALHAQAQGAGVGE